MINKFELSASGFFPLYSKMKIFGLWTKHLRTVDGFHYFIPYYWPNNQLTQTVISSQHHSVCNELWSCEQDLVFTVCGLKSLFRRFVPTETQTDSWKLSAVTPPTLNWDSSSSSPQICSTLSRLILTCLNI